MNAPRWSISLLILGVLLGMPPGGIRGQEAGARAQEGGIRGQEGGAPVWDAAARPPIRVEGEWFYLTGSALFSLGGVWRAGPEAGFGMGDHVDSSGADFFKFTHVGGVLSRPLGSRFTVDVGVQGGLGEFRPKPCSGLFGCYSNDPKPYGAVVVTLSGGGRWFGFGNRFSLVRTQGRQFVAWIPVVLQLRL